MAVCKSCRKTLGIFTISKTCCKCGAKGQTTGDYESWTSRVFPQDEVYDRGFTEQDRSTTAWGTRVERYCDCYRK